MESKGHAGGVRVYDSYAHHPAEIAADLEAARAVAGEGRLVVAFQPHLVSRTREFGPAMGAALGAADEVVVLDVYAARETPDPAVTGRLVADAVPLPAERVVFVAGLDEAAAELAARARDGDLVLTLGAGSVTVGGPAGAGAARSGRVRGLKRRDADRPGRARGPAFAPALHPPAVAAPLAGVALRRRRAPGRRGGRRRHLARLLLVACSP